MCCVVFRLRRELRRNASKLPEGNLWIGRILDIDILSVNGFFDVDKSLIYPDKLQPHGLHIPFAVKMANKFPNKIWNVAGNIYDLNLLPKTLPANLTLSIARSLIADADFIQKATSNETAFINVCLREQLLQLLF